MDGFEAFNVTNWREHPERKLFSVFFFHTIEEGEYFESLLQKHEIWYEKSIDETANRRKALYAVKNSDLSEVRRCNNLTIGHYRKPFIANKVLRYALVILMFSIIGLGIIGAWISDL